MNPSSVYSWDAGSGKAKPYFNNPFNSIFTDTSFGIQVLPSIRFSKHHRLNTSFMFSINSHNEEEQALGNAPDIIAVHGSGVYKTKYLEVQTLTLAVEDEIEPLENLFLSLGISYDAQNLTDHRRRSTQQDTLNEYIEGYQAQDESTIWGTRDSFNPVIGLLYQAIPDFLIFRAAGSIKTTFPTLKAYSRISDTRGDLGIDPERSYNGNIGFELRLFSNAFSWRTDYFYSRFRDKIVKAFNEDLGGLYSVNIDGARTQGIESILTAESGWIVHTFSLSLSLSYTYLYNENLDNSDDERLNMGDGFAESPRHLLTFDLRAKFTTGTSLSVFGTYTRNQFLYVMSERPQTSVAEPYSTEYFEKLRLHDPLFLNIRISQQIFGSASIYVLCKNVLDEYRPNPFNPGPGRTWYFGGKIVL
jgi:outer membrane receptor for ferrienterochelin and colicin